METAEQVDARKTRLGSDEALELLDGINELYVAKGKKLTHIQLKKEKPDDETLTKLLLGPTGNLRAPTIRKGKTLIVGFSEDAYEKTLG